MRRVAAVVSVFMVGLASPGCGGGSSGGGGGATAAASTAARTSPFEVLELTPDRAPAATTPRLTLIFSRPVDVGTVRPGATLVALEDVDTNPGGSFGPLDGDVTALDASGTRLTFTPRRAFREGREVRLVLTRGVLDQDGEPLERGAAGAALSFLGAIPEAVFEGRFQPTAAPAAPPPPPTAAPASPPAASTPAPSTPAPSTPAPSTPTPTPAPSTSPTPPGIRPTAFQPEAGTDVWHIDFDLRATTFLDDMARHGLRSGDATTDRLARDLIAGQAISWCAQKYLRTADGRAVAGRSWRISFTATNPGGTPGRTHSRQAVGGRHATNASTLGVSLYDAGNRGREDNSTAGRLGVFARQIFGQRSVLDPALTSRDRRYLDGSYALGDGTAQEDARLQRILSVASDWGHALGAVIAHEVGHSVGLAHDDSDSIGVMRTATGAQLLSNRNSRMSATSAAVLDRNLGRSR
ncbi:MAG: Ig-like domain-containing protein [Planctomycetes bacterium]|nr:Ig-like domain-containing protein [Planctomycetota bacterium]MBX3716781.1 Ig-like domain-containing protein [Burkholderiales bacterium]